MYLLCKTILHKIHSNSHEITLVLRVFRCSYWKQMIKQTFLHCRGVKGTLALVLAEY